MEAAREARVSRDIFEKQKLDVKCAAELRLNLSAILPTNLLTSFPNVCTVLIP